MVAGAHITLVNGVAASTLDITDRGLAYGDGLFETIRMQKGGDIPLLDLHASRFRNGLERLKFSNIDDLLQSFHNDISTCQNQMQDAALIKVIVTRGSGGRGYSMPPNEEPCLISQTFDLPQWTEEHYSKGVLARICQHPLSSQPALAGVKHLNRLDQVLAASELSVEPEGLVCDLEGNLIEGTKSNVLVFLEDRVITPKLVNCGVNGVLRQFIMNNSESLGVRVEEENFPIAQLTNVKGIAFVNSVFGIWPVRKIADQEYTVDPRSEKIRKVLHRELGFS